jgi:phospholipase/lecithinase/hemolysin
MVNTERKSASSPRWLLVSCLVLVLAAPEWAAAQSRYSGIVVFGTSLSDPGNAFVLVGDANTPPDFALDPLLIPSAPYAKGGHHFSNGATWVEQYARSVGRGDSVGPALATADPAVTNFAVGAARSYDDGLNFNLTRQVDTFLLRSGGVAPPQALYVIEMGGNDIRDAFVIYAAGGNGGVILGKALGAIAANIQRLYVAGAREFLVWAAPDVSLTPAIRSLGPAAQGLASFVTQAFNGVPGVPELPGLTGLLAQLSAGLPGVSFARLDAYQVLHAIVAAPPAFGLTNVTQACVTPNIAPFFCQQADEFLFWDGIHPTKAGHAILAQETATALQ